MTQKEVAEKLGMLQPAYARYESGKTELDYEKLVFLCNLFEITPNDLYGF
ncbi:MAG: helix-turn-helix transcriptional regulator [Firmicutes bacterium]|nr:helix-turn-helix transcriptional regulator [Clostridia bacterium]MBS5024026.1 helix-turn-helix transcriptional regulator [Bacillota bacterium]